VGSPRARSNGPMGPQSSQWTLDVLGEYLQAKGVRPCCVPDPIEVSRRVRLPGRQVHRQIDTPPVRYEKTRAVYTYVTYLTGNREDCTNYTGTPPCKIDSVYVRCILQGVYGRWLARQVCVCVCSHPSCTIHSVRCVYLTGLQGVRLHGRSASQSIGSV
jgi:hypothetical protein